MNNRVAIKTGLNHNYWLIIFWENEIHCQMKQIIKYESQCPEPYLVKLQTHVEQHAVSMCIIHFVSWQQKRMWRERDVTSRGRNRHSHSNTQKTAHWPLTKAGRETSVKRLHERHPSWQGTHTHTHTHTNRSSYCSLLNRFIRQQKMCLMNVCN